MSEIRNYSLFESASPEFPFTFLYPREWNLREIVEKDHAEVFIVRPRPERDRYTASLTIRISWGSQPDLSQIATEHLDRYHAFPGYRVLGRAEGLLGGKRALEVDIVYRTPERLDTVQVSEINVRDRRVLLEQDSRLYELIYDVPEAEYETWVEAFETLARTLTFKEAVAAREFQPLVASPTPAYAVREQRTQYEAGGNNE